MEFKNVFTRVGIVMENHDTFKALKTEYITKGYSATKARYAALGCMSGRSRWNTCKCTDRMQSVF